jgi:4-oxalocrotonate tautomerase
VHRDVNPTAEPQEFVLVFAGTPAGRRQPCGRRPLCREPRSLKGEAMPLIEVRLLEGVFTDDERQQLAEGLIDAVVGVKGESFRTETEVLITTVPVGNWYERGAPISVEGVLGAGS